MSCKLIFDFLNKYIFLENTPTTWFSVKSVVLVGKYIQINRSLSDVREKKKKQRKQRKFSSEDIFYRRIGT